MEPRKIYHEVIVTIHIHVNSLIIAHRTKQLIKHAFVHAGMQTADKDLEYYE